MAAPYVKAANDNGQTAKSTSIPKTLRSATELDYPPFSVIGNDGTAGGFSVELLKAVAEAMHLQITFEVGPWEEIKDKLARGELVRL